MVDRHSVIELSALNVLNALERSERPERAERPWVIARWASFVDDYFTETEFQRWWRYMFSRTFALWVRRGRLHNLQIATGPSRAEIEAMGYSRGGYPWA